MDALAHSEPLLAACYAASVQGFVATGRRAGQRIVQVGLRNHEDALAGAGGSGPAHGFSLYAGRRLRAELPVPIARRRQGNREQQRRPTAQ